MFGLELFTAPNFTQSLLLTVIVELHFNFKKRMVLQGLSHFFKKIYLSMRERESVSEWADGDHLRLLSVSAESFPGLNLMTHKIMT